MMQIKINSRGAPNKTVKYTVFDIFEQFSFHSASVPSGYMFSQTLPFFTRDVRCPKSNVDLHFFLFAQTSSLWILHSKLIFFPSDLAVLKPSVTFISRLHFFSSLMQ